MKSRLTYLMLVISSLLFSIEPIFGQDCQVSGMVYSKEDLKSIRKARIFLLKDNTKVDSTQTDRTGNFTFSRIDCGEYDLMVVKKKYTSVVLQNVTVDNKTGFRHEFKLEKYFDIGRVY